MLRGNAVGPLFVLAAEGLDFQTLLLDQGSADEGPNRVGLPAGRLPDLLEGGAFRPPQQFERLGLLAAIAGFLAAPGARGRPSWRRRPSSSTPWRVRDALWRRAGVQGLGGLPDPGHRRLAVGELLDWGYSEEAVPELNQSGARPGCSELGQLLVTFEVLGPVAVVATFIIQADNTSETIGCCGEFDGCRQWARVRPRTKYVSGSG